MDEPSTLRQGFQDELVQLRLQVELMGVQVDQNLERMRSVLHTGDRMAAEAAFAADDAIDAMNVSLTERCYSLLAREAPIASDLRFVVSVVRILGELERVGDLALRAVKLVPEVPLLSTATGAWDTVLSVADEAVEQYRLALRAWSAQDLGLATELATGRRSLAVYYERLMSEIVGLAGPDAARIAVGLYVAGQSAERIADHAAIIGARLRYLISGEPAHLAAEVR